MSDPTFGVGTFGDVTLDEDGHPVPMHQVLRDVVEQATLADRVGLDHVVVGEHHRDDYAISAPEVVLAAIASRTERVTLASGVTVLSSDDPVRVYERFATLDAVSGGRAEIQVGRGSFVESFPLFGFDLADYEQLFEEKLELLVALRSEQPVTWSGRLRAGLTHAQVYPRTARGALPVWVGVGGTPESVVRAARHGLPMMLAVIGGAHERFTPFVDLFHRAVQELGTGPDGGRLPVGVHSPGFIAETDQQARDLLYPHFAVNRNRIGRERGWPPVTRAQFEAEADGGALLVGSPETVAQRMATVIRTLGVDRFDLKYSNGPQPHRDVMGAIDLYGTSVIPRVRELLAG